MSPRFEPSSRWLLGVDPPPRPSTRRQRLVFLRDLNRRSLLLTTPLLVLTALLIASTAWWVVVGVVVVGGALNVASLELRVRRSPPEPPAP